MSARETSDAIARESVAAAMFRYRSDMEFGPGGVLEPIKPRQVMEVGINAAGDSCARHLSEGRLGLAHAFARVHADLLASQRRMFDRWARRDAEEASR